MVGAAGRTGVDLGGSGGSASGGGSRSPQGAGGTFQARPVEPESLPPPFASADPWSTGHHTGSAGELGGAASGGGGASEPSGGHAATESQRGRRPARIGLFPGAPGGSPASRAEHRESALCGGPAAAGTPLARSRPAPDGSPSGTAALSRSPRSARACGFFLRQGLPQTRWFSLD